MEIKSRRARNTEATRRALITAARRLFGTRGYAAVSVDVVAERARVTTGALYHHFSDKQDLFRAVFDEVNAEVMHDVAAYSGQYSDDWDRLIAGCDAWLDACRSDEIRRIVLLDAPSVLGWEEWRRIDAPHGLSLTIQGLESAMDAGVLKRRSPEALAYLLYGALNEAALALARAEDFDAARAEIRELLIELLSGLRANSGSDDGGR